MAPASSTVLGQYARFLAQEESHGHKPKAPPRGPQAHPFSTQSSPVAKCSPSSLYEQALKQDPHNIPIALGYAKYLRKHNKMAQAEVMYSVAYAEALSLATACGLYTPSFNAKPKNPSTSQMKYARKCIPMALCNYATFLFKRYHRRRAEAKNEEIPMKETLEKNEKMRKAKDVFEQGLNWYVPHALIDKPYY